MKISDYVVTEAGFGADLGAEKFFDIKCRKAGLSPNCVVLVATIRALKMHGGVTKDDLGKENLEALATGMSNLERHLSNIQKYGVPVVVGVNRFSADSEAERQLVVERCQAMGVTAVESDHWASGGAGAEGLAHAVVETIDNKPSNFKPLYGDDIPLWDKVRTVAQQIYGAEDIIGDKKVVGQFKDLQGGGFGDFPVCIAKTQYSFSTDPNLKGAPTGHVVPVREVRVSAGAEFLVVVCGDIMTMPGLPRTPAANSIDVDDSGNIVGLF